MSSIFLDIYGNFTFHVRTFQDQGHVIFPETTENMHKGLRDMDRKCAQFILCTGNVPDIPTLLPTGIVHEISPFPVHFLHKILPFFYIQEWCMKYDLSYIYRTSP